PALPPDARMGQEALPVLLARRAQRLRFIPGAALRPVCGVGPSRALPGHLCRAEAAWHTLRGRVCSWSSPWLPPLSLLQYAPKWSSFGDWVSCCRRVDGALVRSRVMDVGIPRLVSCQTADLVIPRPPHS